MTETTKKQLRTLGIAYGAYCVGVYVGCTLMALSNYAAKAVKDSYRKEAQA